LSGWPWKWNGTPSIRISSTRSGRFSPSAGCSATKRSNGFSRRSDSAPPSPPGEEASASDDEAPEAETSLDPAELAREQIRQHISQTIAGHDLAELIGAIFEARGFTVTVSPPGADGGVDLLMGSGPTGLEAPRVVGQVKTGQADLDQYRSIFGLKESMKADQGLLVAWGGFKKTVRKEARGQHFSMLLWDADDLIDALFDAYGQIRDDIRSRLPLQRTWVLVPNAG
jgi:restriction system protein